MHSVEIGIILYIISQRVQNSTTGVFQDSSVSFYFIFYFLHDDLWEQKWLALFHQKARYQHNISWGTLGAALAGNRSAPPSWIEQVSTSHLASPNFSPRHSSKEQPELCKLAEIWGCLEEPAGSEDQSSEQLPLSFPWNPHMYMPQHPGMSRLISFL